MWVNFSGFACCLGCKSAVGYGARANVGGACDVGEEKVQYLPVPRLFDSIAAAPIWTARFPDVA